MKTASVGGTFIRTPYGLKRWDFLQRCMDCYEEMLAALRQAEASLKNSVRAGEGGIAREESLRIVQEAIRKASA